MIALRGALSRKAESVALLLLAALVVAGCFAAVVYSRLTHTTVGSAGALLLLGVAALGGHFSAAVQARRREIALAQLRGRRGVKLMIFTVAEPCLILITAALVGIGIGWVVVAWLAHRWLGPVNRVEVTTSDWAAVAIVAAVTLVVVVLTSWRTAHETLIDHLDDHARPRASTNAGLFMWLLVLLGAVVALYQASHAKSLRADWISLLSPTVVGLAAGQVVLWLLMLGCALAERWRPNSQSLPWFLTLRRLTRRADSVAVIRIVLAAAVLAGVAANASASAASWRDEVTKEAVGAPLQFPVRGGSLAAYQATKTADPQGAWLMAAAAFPDPSGGQYRRVFVDTSRWDRVVGDFFAGTPAAPISGEISRFPSARSIKVSRGGEFSATVPTASLQHLEQVSFILQYVNDLGGVSLVSLKVTSAKAQRLPAGLSRFTTKVPLCVHSCMATGLQVNGVQTTAEPLHVEAMQLGGVDLLTTPSMSVKAQYRAPAGAGLDIRLPWSDRFGYFDPSATTDVAGPGDQQLTALTTPGLKLDSSGGHRIVYGPDGSDRRVSVVGKVESIPFLGRVGALLDLPQALSGGAGSIPAANVMVLARAGTPPAVLAKLRATGVVAEPISYATVRAAADDQPRAQGTRIFLLIALFGGLIALVSVVSSTTRQVKDRRQEAASLRVVGVPIRQISRGYRREALVVGAAVLIGTAIAVWIACRALLAALPLVTHRPFGLPFDASPRLGLIVIVAVAAGVLVTIVIAAVYRAVGRASPPQLLRDGEPSHAV
ncbi:MAG: ABC transporter permease [Nocardioidaceae bacterium]